MLFIVYIVYERLLLFHVYPSPKGLKITMVFFVYIVYVPLFAFPGLTLSGYYPSPKVPKIPWFSSSTSSTSSCYYPSPKVPKMSMVFFVYIVYF